MEDEFTELYERQQELNREINEFYRNQPNLKVDDYELKDRDGETVRLSDLFGDHDHLVLVHNMGFSCDYCTMWADGFEGIYHYVQQEAAFAVVSDDHWKKQREGADERGWTFPMYSSKGTTLHADLEMAQDDEDQTPYPGASILTRENDSIERFSRAFFGPGDRFCATFAFFDLLPHRPDSI